MTNGPDTRLPGANGDDAGMADVVRRIAGWGLSVGGVTLLVGLVAAVAGWTGPSRIILIAGLGAVVALPVVNVVAALVEELRRREWVFIAAALAVLATLIYNVGRAW